MTDAQTEFVPGQVWRYRTRPGEEESRVIVGRVETLESGLRVVHVKLTGLKVANSGVPGGFSTTLPHVPIADEQFRESVTQRVHEPADLTEFEVGYETWVKHQGGVFTVQLAEIPSFVELALRQPGRPLG